MTLVIGSLADAPDECYLTDVEAGLEPSKVGMEVKSLAHACGSIDRNCEWAPCIVVRTIFCRDDGIEVVVTAIKEDRHENSVCVPQRFGGHSVEEACACGQTRSSPSHQGPLKKEAAIEA
jgi:hypothetical protein